MDMKDIIGEDRELQSELQNQEEQNLEEPQAQPGLNKPNTKKRFKFQIGKKNLAIFVPIFLIIVVLLVLFLFLKPKNNIPVLTGSGAPAVFPSVPKSVSIPPVNNTPVIAHPKTVEPEANIPSVKTNTSSKETLKTKSSKQPKTANDKLNDLFTVQYKHKTKPLAVIPSQGAPQNNALPMPAIPQNMPNFNIKNMANKLKNIGGLPKQNSFTVQGESGGYVVVSCGKQTSYLKAGSSSCGYVLLKADTNGAVFSHNGHIKKIAY